MLQCRHQNQVYILAACGRLAIEMVFIPKAGVSYDLRLLNARLKSTGYRMRHPDYRAALETMWADESWRAEES